MFGILRPQRALIPISDRRRHMSTYCNLCGLLGTQYGLKSRMLVVNDIATLWWLAESTNEATPKHSLVVGNCLRGVGGLRKSGPSKAERLLAALSAYSMGVKVGDDLSDGDRWHARMANRLYRSVFQNARSDLLKVDFAIVDLEAFLADQSRLEEAREPDFARAAEPTAWAYGLVAREIAEACGSDLNAEHAHSVGESLGRCVYLIDAIRDFEKDWEKSYNPLCIASKHCRELPDSLRDEVLYFAGEQLARGRQVAADLGKHMEQIWHAIEIALFSAAGIKDRSTVTLYAGCCIPCGDGAVYVDSSDCNECGNTLTACCCCACACACFSQHC